MTTIKKVDFLLLGPAYPYRGGIADTQHALAKSLKNEGYQVELWTFTQLYPSIIFPGKTQFSNETIPEGYAIHRNIHAYNPFQWKSLAKKINQLQPKAVIFRYWTPFLAPCWISVAKQLDPRIEKVALVDNWRAHEPKPWDSYLTRKFLDCINIFTTLSDYVATEIKKDTQKAVWGKMHPINTGLPPMIDLKKAKNKLKLKLDKDYLLFFGLIRPYKGLDLLIKAMIDHPNKELLVVGEAYEDLKKYESIIKLNRLSDRVKLINRYVLEEEIANYFSVVKAVILPYKTATQSGVVATAYHYETPLLVTNHPGLKEPIIKDKTGVICEISEKAISQGIEKILEVENNDTYRQNLKNKKKQYSWDTYAKEWAAFIHNESE